MMRKEIDENLLLFSARFLEQKEYWKSKLSEGYLETTVLPGAFVKGTKTGEVEDGRIEISIPRDLCDSMIKLSKGADLSIYVIFLAAIKTLIYKYTFNEDITLSSPVYRSNITKETINNRVLIRDRVTADMTFKELILRIKASVSGAYTNQDYPFKKLMEYLFPSSRVHDPTLMTAIQCRFAGIHADSREENIVKSKQCCFSFARHGEHRLEGWIEYDTFTYENYFICQMARHLARILEKGTEDINIPISRIPMLSGEEKKQLLIDFNDNREDFPRYKTVYHRFEEQAGKVPNGIAARGMAQGAWDQGEAAAVRLIGSVGYDQLNRRSNRLARKLRKAGIRDDEPVAIQLERSLLMLESILAVWKAGGAYIPLDTQYPVQRIIGILTDSRAKMLITHSQHLDPQLETAYRGHILRLDVDKPDTSDKAVGDEANLDITFQPDQLAYVIYTSGSTGKPKGAMVEHRGMMNHIQAKVNDLHLTGSSVIAQNSPHTFDISVWQFFTALTLGGTTVIYPDELTMDPPGFVSRLVEDGVTVLEVVPSYLAVMLEVMGESVPLPLVYLLVTGEEVKPHILKKWFGEYPAIPVVNAYGPTEASDDITHHIMNIPPTADQVPIGKPLQNLDIYIVDNNMQICPVGVKGEIWVSGVGVGRGYLNNPELTVENFCFWRPGFLPAARRLSPLYKTGDLGSWRTDGTIEFYGRKDYQVKIRGFRIELGEIEKRLMSHIIVKDAVVIDMEDETGNKYLCAYIVPGNGELASNISPESLADELKNHLANTLPDYMVPPYFVTLEQIPLTPNGKIDRKSLPEPVAVSSAGYTPPRDDMEERLVDIWLEVLGKDSHSLKVGIDSSFFELGGNSIKTIILISKIHKHFNVKIPLEKLFALETIRGISGYLKKASEDRFSSIEPVEKKDYYVVSSEQKRLFFLQEMNRDSIIYNISEAVVLEEELQREKFAEVGMMLTNRHEILRTYFELVDGEPVQKVRDNVNFEITYEEAEEQRARELVDGFMKPFDLGRAPLWRMGLIKIGNPKYILMIDAHHIIADGISVTVFVQEFLHLYGGRELPFPPIQYKDYAQWQIHPRRKEALKKQEAYWLSQFEGPLPILNLPTDYPRSKMQRFEGGVLSFLVGNDRAEALKALALEQGATLQMVMLAIFNVLLAGVCDQEDIVVGIPITGRKHADLETVIGVFVNTLALRNFPSKEKNFLQFLREVKKNSLDAYDNQDYQFENLVTTLGAAKDTRRNPLFDVIFEIQKMQGKPEETAEKKESERGVKPYGVEGKTTKFDLDWTGVETARGIYFWVVYSTKLFERESIDLLVEGYLALIESIVKNPDCKIRELDYHTSLEKELSQVPEVKFNF